MGWKCTPQLIGLVRGTPSKSAKHRANIRAILSEMGTERISKSDTLDRSRSNLNVYTGYESGFACADAMTAAADGYKIQCTGKGGCKAERSLRSDAVIGCAVIFNPPADICKDWTDEQYAKFYRDSADALREVCPEIFRDENLKMTAEHFDEGTGDGNIVRHLHTVYECRDETGKYCGNKIDAKRLVTINQTYPAFMRSRGWTDMDDLDCTDWQRAKTDEAYRTERNSKRSRSGRSVNDYLASKLRTKISEADAMLDDMKDITQQAADREREYHSAKHKVEEDEKQVTDMQDELAAYRAELDQQHDELEADQLQQAAVRKQLEDREKELQEREEALNNREAGITKREAAAEQRDAKLNDRETRLNGREAALESNKQKYAAELIKARKEANKELERRENDVAAREAAVEQREDAADDLYNAATDAIKAAKRVDGMYSITRTWMEHMGNPDKRTGKTVSFATLYDAWVRQQRQKGYDIDTDIDRYMTGVYSKEALLNKARAAARRISWSDTSFSDTEYEHGGLSL